MQRITIKNLETLVEYLNKEAGTPLQPWKDGKAQIGNFHLSQAYGGVELVQMSSDGGGVRNVLHTGHVPKRELYEKIHAFIMGMRFQKHEVA